MVSTVTGLLSSGSNWFSEMSDSPYTSPHCLVYEGVAAPVLAVPWVPLLTEEKLEAPVGERDALRWVGVSMPRTALSGTAWTVGAA